MSENSIALINWQAQLLRFTVFANLETELPRWWKEVVEEEPDKIDAQPKQKLYKYESTYGLGKLILQTQLNRVDWVHIVGDPNGTEISTLGTYKDVLSTFSKLIHKWFGSKELPAWNRVAYGVILVCPADSRPESYRQLGRLLHGVTIDTENSSDFSYQINRSRLISIDTTEFKINRLSKWSTAASIYSVIEFSNEGIRQLPQSLGGVASRLELDINTAAEMKGPFEAHLLPEVFDKLVDLGNEISERGDIA